MKRVGFAQPNFRTGPAHLNSYYLPYSLGSLWAYALTDQFVKDNYTSSFWLFKRDPITDTYVTELATSADVVLFSTYVWNWNYCITLAKKLKAVRPDIFIIFGGPQVPHTDVEFRTKYPFIDCVVIGEGEIAFVEILKKLDANDDIPLFYSVPRLRDLDLPSPYLTGLFDELIEQHPDIEWVPTLETDRGCPYKCTFCDWGSATASKVVKVYLDRIQDELEWIAEKQLPFLSLTSANFGIYKDRDHLIADKIVEMRKAYGVPSGISVSYAKNSNADVFAIIKKFSSVGIQNGFTLSLQSTTSKVLEAIKRTNMDINDVSAIATQAAKDNIPVITEIILGLPEETKETFFQSIAKVIESGLHNGLEIFFLNMIENAPMKEQINQYAMETFTVYDMFYESAPSEAEDETKEGIEIIKSTSTMSNEDLQECYLYTWFIIGLHSSGYTDIISKYCVLEKHTDYYEFYRDLIAYLRTTELFGSWAKEVAESYNRWVTTGFFNLHFDEFIFSSWQITHTLNAIIQLSQKETVAVAIIADYVEKKYNIDTRIINDYKTIVHQRVKKITDYKYTPEQFTTDTNLWCYANKYTNELTFTPTSYIVYDRHNQFSDTMQQHVDNIVYGRRRTWGLNIVDKQ
jgi:radical SAM superfamily enzyme YgiQ (UPF0313 family)